MEQKQKKIVLAGLVGIFVIILISNLVSGVKKGASKTNRAPRTSEAERSLPEGDENRTPSTELDSMLETDTLQEPVKSRYESWGRDPFNIGKEASIGSPLKLEGIIWDEVKPFCLISGVALYVGSRYEGYTVMRIEKGKVIVSDGVKETVLRLGGE